MNHSQYPQGRNGQTDSQSDDRLLFATENGWVRHCACHDVMVLHFAEHWMALTRAQYRDFHVRLIAAVRCPMGQMQLNAGGRFAFSSGSKAPAFTLDRVGMEELLWLLDSARFMLEATRRTDRLISPHQLDVGPFAGSQHVVVRSRTFLVR
jgi:hypothetical protein